jgi:hypothetical protein
MRPRNRHADVMPVRHGEDDTPVVITGLVPVISIA